MHHYSKPSVENNSDKHHAFLMTTTWCSLLLSPLTAHMCIMSFGSMIKCLTLTISSYIENLETCEPIINACSLSLLNHVDMLIWHCISLLNKLEWAHYLINSACWAQPSWEPHFNPHANIWYNNISFSIFAHEANKLER